MAMRGSLTRLLPASRTRTLILGSSVRRLATTSYSSAPSNDHKVERLRLQAVHGRSAYGIGHATARKSRREHGGSANLGQILAMASKCLIK
ncbi:hypothetical protein BDV10DRAFT_49525 [Aspergillus recurvatus]